MGDIASLLRIKFLGHGPLNGWADISGRKSNLVILAGPNFEFNEPLHYAVRVESADYEGLSARHIGIIRPPLNEKPVIETSPYNSFMILEDSRSFRDQKAIDALTNNFGLPPVYSETFAAALRGEEFKLPEDRYNPC